MKINDILVILHFLPLTTISPLLIPNLEVKSGECCCNISQMSGDVYLNMSKITICMLYYVIPQGCLSN